MDFKEELPSSKSLVNRYLILKEGYPDLSLKWKSQALDVVNLEDALSKYKTENEIYVGEGGTTFRFLSLYLSSQKGKWKLYGEADLFKRPHTDLILALKALGCKAELSGENALIIESEGWQRKSIEVDAVYTTQVLTGLVLAALASKNELEIKLGTTGKNSDYFVMTQDFVSSLGFTVFMDNNKIHIPGNQMFSEDMKIKHIESDWSSAAFIYVLAALKGRAKVQGVMRQSVQPDSRIIEILKDSGVEVFSGFKVKRNNKIKAYMPMHVNLQKSPDLFPVLSVFACFCRGESVLYGAPQLAFKESNRIELMYRLLVQCGYKVNRMEDGLKIKGAGFNILEHKPFSFDVSSDHRLFMACEILKFMGYEIEMTGTDSIKKSFPEYLTSEWTV